MHYACSYDKLAASSILKFELLVPMYYIHKLYVVSPCSLVVITTAENVVEVASDIPSKPILSGSQRIRCAPKILIFDRIKAEVVFSKH